MAKKRGSKSPARRTPPSAAGRGAAWLAVLLLLAAGGMGAGYFLRGDSPVPPAAKAVVKPASQPGAGAQAASASGAAASRKIAGAAKPVAKAAPNVTAVAVVKFEAPDVYPRSPASWFEAQVALARRGFSCGPLDGVGGAQTVAAWRAFQAQAGLAETSWLDPRTCAALPLDGPATTKYIVTAADLARLQPLSPTWLGMSQQSALDFETLLELVAEKSRAHPKLLRELNPGFAWEQARAGAVVVVPAAERTVSLAKAAALHVQLEAHTLQAYDADGRLLAHFPVSIAKKAEKRPVGELHVVVAAPNPNYTFDPEVFPESLEAQELGRKLLLPPGPNNPVGVAWIGLDRTGYGIHGTPNPEQVGRTESHGCFRLANWDARVLLDLVWVGMPVYVDP